MHAVIIDDKQNLVWSEVADPAPTGDQIVIEIHATALNRADLMQRAGNYPPPPGWPVWPGLEAAGVVLRAPENSRWKTGDKVCALLGGGGYAEKVAVPSGMVMPVPEGLSMSEAAAIPEAFATSYLNLCLEGGMKEGDTVLIQAGASGLGMAAIQLAKAMGAKVMTTVGSEEKAAFVRTLGADIVVNRTKDDLAETMAKNPVDIALDCVGGKDAGKCIGQMAQGGRWIQIATLAGAMTELDLNNYFRRGLRLIGSTLRSRTSEMKAKILSEMEKNLWPKFSSGDIKVIIHKTLPMQQAEEAHAILERRENIGKVILTLE